MPRLTPKQKQEIVDRRGNVCDRDGHRHRTSTLDIHHKDRNPNNNDPINLRVLCKKHHDELHARAGP